MNKLKEVYNGKESLVLTVWVWLVLGYFILKTVHLGCVSTGVPLFAALSGILLLSYTIFAMIGAWRAADVYTGSVVWAGLTKTSLFIFGLSSVLMAII